MSINPSINGKGAKDDVDSIMPLLFATIGNPSISFKKMAAMDELGRTESTLEHRFRKWRQKGREIAAANPEHAGVTAAAGTQTSIPKKRASAKKNRDSKGKAPAKQADVGDEEDEVEDDAGIAIKKEADDRANDNGDEKTLPGAAYGTVKVTKAIATNDTKKRSAAEKNITDRPEGSAESPVKKAKVAKKGTAKVVKKQAASLRRGELSEEIEETKLKGNGQGRRAAAKGTRKAIAPPKEKMWRADVTAKQGRIALPEDEDIDIEFDGEDEEQVEIEFVQEGV